MTFSPAPLNQITAPQITPITHILFDFDDTVTWSGQLPKEGVNALYDAHEAGFQLIVVTGRSASWAEMLMRLFPFEAAVAETGALCFYRPTLKSRVSILHSIESKKERREQRFLREKIGDQILNRFPDLRYALDNPGRIYDSAFDLVEDGPPPQEATLKQVHTFLENAGLNWAQSSVHLNFFHGQFDKAAMVERYFLEIQKIDWAQARHQLAYLGDSTNDGPLFAAVPLSIGMANVSSFLPQLSGLNQTPAYISTQNGGYGFAETIQLFSRLKNT